MQLDFSLISTGRINTSNVFAKANVLHTEIVNCNMQITRHTIAVLFHETELYIKTLHKITINMYLKVTN